MPRRPIGDYAMSGAQRQALYRERRRRELDRLRAELEAKTSRQPASARPPSISAPGENHINIIEQLKKYPGPVMHWLCPYLSTDALRAIRDEVDKALAKRAITTESNSLPGFPGWLSQSGDDDD